LALLRASAGDLIAEHGFEAMSLRQLAARVGLSAASLYNYIGGKQDLVYELLAEMMGDLLDAVAARVVPQVSPWGPLAQLHAFVLLHIQFHVDLKNDVFNPAGMPFQPHPRVL